MRITEEPYSVIHLFLTVFFFHFVCYHSGRINLNCKVFFIHYCAADKTVMEGFIEFELIDLNYTLVAVVVIIT